MSAAEVAKNKEARELLSILGLQLGVTYTAETARKLPYAHLMIFSDQDVDGSHIGGLLAEGLREEVRGLLVRAEGAGAAHVDAHAGAWRHV